MTWRPLPNTIVNGTTQISITQSWQFRPYAVPCNQSMITNQYPLINSQGAITCTTAPSSACGGYSSITVTEICTDISILLDSMNGIKTTVETIKLNSSFVINFSASGWIALGIQTGVNNTAPWSFSNYIDTTLRADGTVNTPPVASLLSPVLVFQNTTTSISIPTIDIDNDIVRCRWAVTNSSTNPYDECGGACHAVNGSTYIIPENCTLVFDSRGIAPGTSYAITLQVEDFPNSLSNDSYSSIPLQFLVRVVSVPTNCNSTPVITANVSACVAITANSVFIFQVTITTGCRNTTIQDVRRAPPLNMFRTTLTQTTNTTWTFNEVWNSDSTQIGPQVYCVVAIDSLSIVSPQFCNTFTVVAPGSAALCPGVTTTAAPTTTQGPNPGFTPDIGLIVGVTVGGIACLVGILCACTYCWCFRSIFSGATNSKIHPEELNEPVQKFMRSSNIEARSVQRPTIPPPYRQDDKGRERRQRPVNIHENRTSQLRKILHHQ